MENAKNLKDIAVMRPYRLEKLKGEREGEYSLRLGNSTGYRLIIVPLDHNGQPWKENDINKICQQTQTVRIMEVSNHYE